MKVSSFHIITQKTARVFTLMDDAVKPRVIWIALHGYGQLPEFFIRKFKPVADRFHAVVCPEGLSRFYLEGATGRVGASWMTKEDRLQEIEDYNAYLSSLLAGLKKDNQGAVIVVLGFSQGGATAVRWLMQNRPEVHAMALWSAYFPEDLEYAAGWPYPNGFPVFMVRGDNDPYSNPLSHNISGLPEFKMLSFSGGHQIDPESLTKLKAMVEAIFDLQTKT